MAGGVSENIVVNAKNQTKQAFDQMAKDAKTATNSVVQTFDNLNSQMTAAGVAIGAVGAAMTAGIASSTQYAARVQTLGVVMQQIGKVNGYTADQMADFEKQVKDMGITTEASRESLIRLSQANIDLEKASKLARIAQDAAVIAGTNSSEAFDREVQGIVTLNPLILRRLGLVVNLNAAEQKYADSVGKSAIELTAQEKQQIAVNEVLAAGERIQGAYTSAMETAGKQVTSLDRYIKEASLAIGNNFLPIYSDMIMTVSGGLKWFNAQNDAFKKTTSYALAATAGYTTLAGAGLIFAAKLPGMISSISKIGAGMKVLMTTTPALASSTGRLTTAFMGASTAGAGLITVFSSTAVLLAWGIAIEQLIQRLVQLHDGIVKMNELLDEHSTDMSNTARNYEEYRTELERAAKVAGYQVDAEGNLVKVYATRMGMMTQMIQEHYMLSEAEFNTARAGAYLKASYDANADAAKTNADAMAELKKKAEDLAKAEEEAAQAALDAGMSGELQNTWGEYGKTINGLTKEHNDLVKQLDQAKTSAFGYAAATNYVRDVMQGTNKRGYQPFIRANKDLIGQHNDIEKQLVRARRLFGDNSEEVQKYTNQLADNERQLALAANSQNLQKQLANLKAKGYEPTSQAIKDLEEKLRANEQAQQDAASAAKEATKQFIFEKVAANLNADSAMEIAHKLGILSESDYNTVKATQALTKSYDEADGQMGNFNDQLKENPGLLQQYSSDVGDLAEAIARLQSKDITITETTIKREIREIWEYRKGLATPEHGGIGGVQKAGGGPVQAGRAYPWNEPASAPETFIPAGNGYILNFRQAQEALANAAGSGKGKGGGDTYYVNINDAAAMRMFLDDKRRREMEQAEALMQ